MSKNYKAINISCQNSINLRLQLQLQSNNEPLATHLVWVLRSRPGILSSTEKGLNEPKLPAAKGWFCWPRVSAAQQQLPRTSSWKKPRTCRTCYWKATSPGLQFQVGSWQICYNVIVPYMMDSTIAANSWLKSWLTKSFFQIMVRYCCFNQLIMTKFTWLKLTGISNKESQNIFQWEKAPD